jgi:hypothetical protein
MLAIRLQIASQIREKARQNGPFQIRFLVGAVGFEPTTS